MDFNDEDIETIPDPNIEYRYAPGSWSSGMTYLMKLCLMTNKYPQLNDKIDEYLSYKIEELNKQNTYGWSALMIACENFNTWSSKETVEILLKNNANVNLQTSHGISALMIVCCHNSNDSTKEIINSLLKNNADINLQNIVGWTALIYACSYDDNYNIGTVKLLLKEYIKKECNLLTIIKQMTDVNEHNFLNKYIKKRAIIKYNKTKFI